MTEENWWNSLLKEEEISEAEIVIENDDDTWFQDRPDEEDVAAQDRGETLDIEYHKEREVPSNQCAADTRNPGMIFSDTFYHRHESETLFTRALKNSDCLFAPGTSWMRGKSGSKVEPDFMVLADLQLGIMEVNGGSHKGELADKRQKRIQCFRDQCVFVQDYAVPENYDLDFAYSCVKDFLKRLKDRKIYMAGRSGGIDDDG